jgi:hypothetical protein
MRNAPLMPRQASDGIAWTLDLSKTRFLGRQEVFELWLVVPSVQSHFLDLVLVFLNGTGKSCHVHHDRFRFIGFKSLKEIPGKLWK